MDLIYVGSYSNDKSSFFKKINRFTTNSKNTDTKKAPMSFVGSATLYGEVTWTVLKAEKTRNRSRRRALKIEWTEKVLNGIRFLGACRNQYMDYVV